MTIFSVDGDGDIANFGAFFKAIGLKTFAFYDQKQRKSEKNQQLADNFVIARETSFTGIEKLLVAKVPVDQQWDMLEALRNAGSLYAGITAARPADDLVRQHMQGALASNKGNGFAAALIERCCIAELPTSIVTFLREVYAHFPKPQRPAVVPPARRSPDAGTATTATTGSETEDSAGRPRHPRSGREAMIGETSTGEVAADAAGHALVSGGPGSGKTTLALRKALACLQAGLKPGQAVLFLSFSRAAIARLLRRARLLFRPRTGTRCPYRRSTDFVGAFSSLTGIS